MSNIVYKPYILKSITGNTTFYSGSSFIDSNIFIHSGVTLTLSQFDKKNINKNDIIDNLINYIDNGINKYSLDILIVDIYNMYDIISESGEYCLKISYNNETLNYLMLIIYDSYIPVFQNNNILDNVSIKEKSIHIINKYNIYYNYSTNGGTWLGGGLISPYEVNLKIFHDGVTGWTSNSLRDLFVSCLIDSNGVYVDIDKLDFLIYSNYSNFPISNIINSGSYNIKISYFYSNIIVFNDTFNIYVNDYNVKIVYKPHIITSKFTGTTTSYSGSSSDINPNIIISSGATLTLSHFYRNFITKNDIIDNLINYVDYNVNKYHLDVNIVDYNINYDIISEPGEYCLKISYNNEVLDYLILVIYESYVPFIDEYICIGDTNTTNNNDIDIEKYTIYYNYSTSGGTWLGGGLVAPHDVYLKFVHDGITGWTLNTLRYLFISGLTDNLGVNINIDKLSIVIYNCGSTIPLYDIISCGNYNINVSYVDSFGSVYGDIFDVYVNDVPPTIVYKPYIITKNLTGFTNFYSGASSEINPDIFISSGFTLNLNGFDDYVIYKNDIIDNIVNYAYDNFDSDINKYMIRVLLFGKYNRNSIVFENITKPGIYCIKISLKNNNGYEIVYYFIVSVVFDFSVYSEGYWQDGKVWVDKTLWLDHPIIPYRHK